MIKQSLFQKHTQIVSVKVNVTETNCFSTRENIFVFYILTTFLGHFVSLGIEYIGLLLKTLQLSVAWNILNYFYLCLKIVVIQFIESHAFKDWIFKLNSYTNHDTWYLGVLRVWFWNYIRAIFLVLTYIDIIMMSLC